MLVFLKKKDWFYILVQGFIQDFSLTSSYLSVLFFSIPSKAQWLIYMSVEPTLYIFVFYDFQNKDEYHPKQH
jgi:hypothetical protein